MLTHTIDAVEFSARGGRPGMTFGLPMRDADSWNTVVFTDSAGATVKFPPRPRTGVAVVSVDDAQKLDTKTAAGKKGATRTKQGAEAAPLRIEVEFDPDYWHEYEPALRAISPRGSARGGPFLISCPALPPGLEAVLIESISPMGTAIVQNGRGKVTISAKETTFNRGVPGGVAGKAAGSGALSDEERTALLAERQLNIFLIAQDELAAATAGTEQARQEAIQRREERKRIVSGIEQRLASADAEKPSTTETETPTTIGKNYTNGGKTGKISEADPGSYDPAKNPDAPKGGP